MQVLDKGIVELKSSMGGDLSVVAAARVSNGATFEEASKGTESDGKLINYLVKHRHGTPFEHAVFTFFIKCPLFVRSEWHRHRMASYNEISGRYVKYEAEFYIPDRWRVQAPSNKQGSMFPDLSEANDFDDNCYALFVDSVKFSYDMYEALLAQGVAKEMARMVLPANLYTQFYFTVNARGLMNFLSLRNAPDAQWEIKQFAEALEGIFRGLMPLTYNAWIKNERVAP